MWGRKARTEVVDYLIHMVQKEGRVASMKSYTEVQELARTCAAPYSTCTLIEAMAVFTQLKRVITGGN